MNSGKNNEFPELKRWGRFGLGGGAVFEPEGVDITDCPPSERKKLGMPGFDEFHHIPSFNGLQGRSRPAVKRGKFKAHPFLEGVEVSDAGGVRYYGESRPSFMISGQMAGTVLTRLFTPRAPRLCLEFKHNFHVAQVARELTLSAIPLAILVQETHDSANPPRPAEGGGDFEASGGFGTWIRKAVEEPLLPPQEWPLSNRLGGWVISLRARAWNSWLDSLDELSTG